MTTRTHAALLAAVVAWSGASPAQDHQQHQAGPGARCDGPEFACAMEATPALAGDGSVWLAWTSASRVYAARSTDQGRSFPAPVEITRGPAKLDHSADTRPQIVVDRAGRVTVGYAVMTDVQFKGELFHAHSTDGGRAFSAPRPLNANPAGKRFLSLALDPDGAVFASWVDKRDLAAAQAAGRKYAGAAVYAAWSGDGGATFGDPVTVREHTCECCRVAVDFAGAGRPVVLWRSLFGKARDHAIATFNAPTVVGAVHRISVDDWQIDACPHHGPSVAVAGDGTYHVAWFTASDTRKGLFYARSGDAGATFSAPAPIGAPARQPARPQLLARGEDLWLAWREYDGQATEIVVRHSASGGRDWSTPRVVGRSASTADHPVLVSDGRRAFVSWLTRAEGYRLLPLQAADFRAGSTASLTSRIAASGSP